MSLRRRLAVTITALIAAGSLIFGLVSLTVIDNVLRAGVDSKLFTVAKAAADVVDIRNNKALVDQDDVAQMNALHDPEEHLNVTDAQGQRIFGDPIPTGTDAAHLRFGTTDLIRGRTMKLARVTVWRSDRFIEQVHNTALLTFAIVGIAIVALAYVFSGWYAGRILGPVERVARLAERIESRHLSLRLNAGGDDELGRLCASFDRMLERLEASFESERRFVTDASHELRTPLAVVRAETDLALRRQRSEAEYVTALESIDREATRLEKMVDQLLDTMRACVPLPTGLPSARYRLPTSSGAGTRCSARSWR
jgi:signal transduction histidine kinase